jgi:superfamily II DNA/RNA helicase
MSELFVDLGIDEDFNPYFKEVGIKKPNSVQNKIIPKFLKKESFFCLAQTGSGKTLAFALPICEMIKRMEDEQGLNEAFASPRAVIVAPTKELAVQIDSVIKSISHHVKVRVRKILGGVTSSAQKNLRSSSFEILIATPTALGRALKKGEIRFDCLETIVFDEADQLFDKGFGKEINGVLRHVEFDKSSVNFFSATFNEEVETHIKEKFKKLNPEIVTFTTSHRVQSKVDTFNIYLSPKEKQEMLKGFLTKSAKGRGIIFINQKNQVEEVDAFLKERMPTLKYKVLHGGLTQKERMANHKAFIDGKAQVLVATDIAARGIDIKDLKWILNFGLPKTAIYYLHRCGRVARAGKTGIVYNFVTGFDSRLIGFINESIKSQTQLNLDFITAKVEKAVKVLTTKAPTKKKVKAKRVKQTKRTMYKK